MRRVCSYCNEVFDEVDNGNDVDSHGACDVCAPYMDAYISSAVDAIPCSVAEKIRFSILAFVMRRQGWTVEVEGNDHLLLTVMGTPGSKDVPIVFNPGLELWVDRTDTGRVSTRRGDIGSLSEVIKRIKTGRIYPPRVY